MKLILILTVFLSLSAQATVYNCRAGHVKLDLNVDPTFTTLTIRDAQLGNFYYDGVASDVNDSNNRLRLRFETRSRDYLELEFKSSAVAEEDETIFGFIRGWSGAGFLNETMKCFKSTNPFNNG